MRSERSDEYRRIERIIHQCIDEGWIGEGMNGETVFIAEAVRILARPLEEANAELARYRQNSAENEALAAGEYSPPHGESFSEGECIASLVAEVKRLRSVVMDKEGHMLNLLEALGKPWIECDGNKDLWEELLNLAREVGAEVKRLREYQAWSVSSAGGENPELTRLRAVNAELLEESRRVFDYLKTYDSCYDRLPQLRNAINSAEQAGKGDSK